MRLFTGIELADGVRSDVAAISDELRQRVHNAAPRARVTWIPVERLHLTVRFIGEVGAEMAERVVATLREPLKVPAFTLAFDRLGAFPDKGPPRVLWIGVGEGREPAIRAEAAVSDRLAAIGISHEERAYTPHLTLARVREAAGLRTAALFAGLVPRLGSMRVETITLFQSNLSPKGPTYVVLERTRLRDG